LLDDRFSSGYTGAYMSRIERVIILGGILALIIVPSLALYLSHPSESVEKISEEGNVPVPGAPGAQHWHAALIVYVNGQGFDFGDNKYMLQSKLVHFEDDDPYIVHKHTTGVTIPYFLSTLKVFMDSTCIDFQNLETPERYCTNATNTLRFLVNGEEVADPTRYDIKHNDRFLVYYGPLTGIQLKFLSNQVPFVPVFKEKTLEEVSQDLRDEGFLK
jgi:hypothetical protein